METMGGGTELGVVQCCLDVNVYMLFVWEVH